MLEKRRKQPEEGAITLPLNPITRLSYKENITPVQETKAQRSATQMEKCVSEIFYYYRGLQCIQYRQSDLAPEVYRPLKNNSLP